MVNEKHMQTDERRASAGRMNSRMRMHVWGAGLLLGMASVFPGSLSAAPLRVIDETAIPFAAFLPKPDFDQRYPGETVNEVGDLESGWYVIYEHASLNYYFGPILLESIGQDYLDQLTETVEAAVAQRPSIQDYRLELSYEPSEAAASDSAESAPPSEESSSNPIPPQPQPKPSFWGLIKRVFGFG